MPKIAEARILIMATDGFEESELFGPLGILKQRGAEVRLAAPSLRPIQATVRDDPGRTIRPDLKIDQAKVEEFDALVLPGGVINPDALRTDKTAVALVRAFVAAKKPVAAICHGPWVLCSTKALRGKKATCFFAIKDDVINAGANYVDAEVVRDGNLVTSRKPDDLPAFMKALMEAAAERRKG
jgi:protease I